MSTTVSARQAVGQRGKAAQIRQPDRGMHRLGVAAPDLAADDPFAGAVADIGVEQHVGGAAKVDHFDQPRQRRHDQSQRRQLIIGKAAGLLGGPARGVRRPLDEQQRHREIVGNAFAAHVVDNRKTPAVGIARRGTGLPSPRETRSSSGLALNSGVVQKVEIDRADLTRSPGFQMKLRPKYPDAACERRSRPARAECRPPSAACRVPPSNRSRPAPTCRHRSASRRCP